MCAAGHAIFTEVQSWSVAVVRTEHAPPNVGTCLYIRPDRAKATGSAGDRQWNRTGYGECSRNIDRQAR